MANRFSNSAVRKLKRTERDSRFGNPPPARNERFNRNLPPFAWYMVSDDAGDVAGTPSAATTLTPGGSCNVVQTTFKADAADNLNEGAYEAIQTPKIPLDAYDFTESAFARLGDLILLWYNPQYYRLEVFVQQQTPTLHFRAPADGIPPGQAVDCEVISYSDGRTVESGEMVMVFNWNSEAICETGNHQGKANFQVDIWHYLAEDRVCE